MGRRWRRPAILIPFVLFLILIVAFASYMVPERLVRLWALEARQIGLVRQGTMSMWPISTEHGDRVLRVQLRGGDKDDIATGVRLTLLSSEGRVTWHNVVMTTDSLPAEIEQSPMVTTIPGTSTVFVTTFGLHGTTTRSFEAGSEPQREGPAHQGIPVAASKRAIIYARCTIAPDTFGNGCRLTGQRRSDGAEIWSAPLASSDLADARAHADLEPGWGFPAPGVTGLDLPLSQNVVRHLPEGSVHSARYARAVVDPVTPMSPGIRNVSGPLPGFTGAVLEDGRTYLIDPDRGPLGPGIEGIPLSVGPHGLMVRSAHDALVRIDVGGIEHPVNLPALKGRTDWSVRSLPTSTVVKLGDAVWAVGADPDKPVRLPASAATSVTRAVAGQDGTLIVTTATAVESIDLITGTMRWTRPLKHCGLDDARTRMASGFGIIAISCPTVLFDGSFGTGNTMQLSRLSAQDGSVLDTWNLPTVRRREHIRRDPNALVIAPLPGGAVRGELGVGHPAFITGSGLDNRR